ncbi:MAG: class I SAM-dependent methyltransferase [Balneolales bacterium]|nr:class I SAM-dependent methyltransferase [Balneolales bacterium]
MNISLTAAYLAVKFYGLSRDPRISSVFPPFVINFYEQMVRFLPRHLSWYQRTLNVGLLRRFFILSEELLLPGDLMHVLCRKYYLTKMVDEALEKGVEQLVNLGAGFDHLGVYASQKGIPAFELDYPHMIEQKRRFLVKEGYENKLIHLQETDITKQRLGETLLSIEEFDPKKRTLFIAEGFFDYLSLLPSEQVLEDIRTMNIRNQLISTFFSLDELPFMHQMSFRGGVSLVGESLKFKITKPEFVELLEELEFELEEELNSLLMRDDLVKRMGVKLPVLKGFYILNFSVRSNLF